MALWFRQRDRKESRSCQTCREYKMGGQFYDWYGHPALSHTYSMGVLVMCTKCAKRELGPVGFKKLNSRGVL